MLTRSVSEDSVACRFVGDRLADASGSPGGDRSSYLVDEHE